MQPGLVSTPEPSEQSYVCRSCQGTTDQSPRSAWPWEMCLETLLCPLITWKTSWAGSTLPMELPFPSFQAKQCSCLAEGQQLCQCQSWSGAGLTFSTRPELTLVWEMIPFPGTGVSCIQPSCRPALHLCNIRALDRLNDILSVWLPGRRSHGCGVQGMLFLLWSRADMSWASCQLWPFCRTRTQPGKPLFPSSLGGLCPGFLWGLIK